MVNKAKTVGQIMSAFTKALAEASPATTVNVNFTDGKYTVTVGNLTVTRNKLYNAMSAAAKQWLGAPQENTARERLRARVGADLVEATAGDDSEGYGDDF